MFTRTSQHAIRAMVAISRLDGGGYVTAKTVSRLVDIPSPFLAKVLQRLTAAGLLHSLRGPTGGVTLARPASEIRLAEIVEAIDGRNPFDACPFGWPDCSADDPCPIHAAWDQVLRPASELLRTATLAETVELVSHGSAESHGIKAD